MKNGILLAGGTGTRLYPLTHVVNKHLLAVNGKFIIDYPLNTLKRMGVENCTVVLGGNHFSQVVDHLRDGKQHGMKFNYVYQGEAKGIAQAINLCRRHVEDEAEFAVILGDNIFQDPIQWLDDDYQPRARILLKEVNDPSRFGVAFINALGIRKIEEKPRVLDPHYKCLAITGCYRFTHHYFRLFQELTPSARGEYEVVDIIRRYLEGGELRNSVYGGFWSDAGTHESIARCNDHFYRG